MVAEPQLIGAIDWSHDANVLSLLDAAGNKVLEGSFAASGEGLLSLRSQLLELCKTPEAVWIAIEASRGPVVEALLEVGIAVFAINPKQSERFRERHHAAPLKDDRRDAWSMARALRMEPGAFRRLAVEPGLITEIRECGRALQEVREIRRRVAQRVWDHLQRYFPQMVQAFPDLQSNSFVRIWRAIPTPQAAAAMQNAEVAKLLRGAGVRRLSGEKLMAIMRQKALPVTDATVKATSRRVRDQVEQIELLNRQERGLRRELDALWKRFRQADAGTGELTSRDVDIVLSVPGVGTIVLAALFAEAWRPLAERNYDQLRALSGAAPVTRGTGQRRRMKQVQMRQACQHRVREAVFNMARVAMQRDQHWKSRYAAMRARGHSHGRALRGIADRMLNVIIAMLRAGTVYDAAKLRAA